MASLDFISTAVIQSELKPLIGNRGNGIIKKWVEYHPGMLDYYIKTYGLEATIEGVTNAYDTYENPCLKNIRDCIEDSLQASGKV